MKILFAAIPTAGHVNPLLTIARMAKARGNDTLFTTGRHFASAVDAADARFVPLAADADLDFREIEKLFPELAKLPPGPEKGKTAANDHRFIDQYDCLSSGI